MRLAGNLIVRSLIPDLLADGILKNHLCFSRSYVSDGLLEATRNGLFSRFMIGAMCVLCGLNWCIFSLASDRVLLSPKREL